MQRKRSHLFGQAMLVGLLLGLVFATSGCGGSSQSQQQASQSKTQLDTTLQHARDIGVPVSSLQTIIQQEKNLSSTSAPFTLFDDTSATNYYLNQAKQYKQLATQAQSVIDNTTSDSQTKAQVSVQYFQSALNKVQNLKISTIPTFTQELTNAQSQLSTAQYPKQFFAISDDANSAGSALTLLNTTYGQLVTFNNAIKQMNKAHIDVTAMQTQYQNDMSTINTITKTVDFTNLNSLVNAQYQMAVVNSIQALPFVGNIKLGQFSTQITLLKTYGMDASSYQQLYNADAQQMHNAKTIADYLAVSGKIDADMSTMQNDLTQGAATYLIGELDREANAWGKAHAYHDKFDGNNYILDSGYTLNGIGWWFQQQVGWSWQPSDYQAIVQSENDEFFNFHMMQQDYSDTTLYNQVHATDLQIMQHYPNLQHGTVLMVSTVEQAMRFYQNGKLIKSFLVTMGRVERPALPGYWTVVDRKSPMEFKSVDPPSSPYWYPPTPIHYAILYHWNGYFVHDAWWRVNFGPGTQFPHYDTGGDESFAGNGSHGCINMQENDAAWVYNNTDFNTQIMVY
ncbi:MAG TPA: L,D-transpeptidase [Ktedonobacteraceae bacterium]|nr:L,D-transpeptidase [Ktedonobacteraceae bacterium]